MTVANQTRRIAAIGNAAIGQEVPFSFPYAATSDITVYSRVTATGVETLLTETTNYTLTAPSDTGGTLTTVTAVVATSEIHIIRDTPKTQSLDLVQGGSYNAENIEDAFDKNTKLIIENNDSLDRALRAPATDAVALDLEIPNSVDRASKNLGFDAGGNVTVTDDIGTFTTQTAVWEDVIVKSPYVDVRAYGAVCNGTTNDAVAVQAALDTMTSGGTLLIPGVCAIGSAAWVGITLTSQSDITIRGIGAQGGFKILVAPSQTVESIATVFKFDTCTNIKFENIDLDGNSIDTALIGMDTCTECTINVNFIHDTDTGSSDAQGIISVEGNRNVFVHNAINNVSVGMLIGNTNTDKTEDNAIIAYNTITDCQATCIGGTLDGGTIIGNQCLNSAGSGIALGSSSTEVYKNTTITGNVCSGNAFSGIQADVVGTAYIQGVTITGNICTNNDSDGILLANMIDSSCTGNICRDNNADGVGNGFGIQLAIFNKRMIVSNNYCYDSRAGASREQTSGMRIVSGTNVDGINNIIISGNFCYNHPSYGIQITNSGVGTIDKVSLKGNHCFSNTDTGIIVSDVADGDITGINAVLNNCYDNGTDYRFDPTDTINFLNDAQTSEGVKITANSMMVADGTNWRSAIMVCNENQTVCNENMVIVN